MKPGIYEIPASEYHADKLCPTPSLSAGMINHMLTAPALCFHNSSRLNPAYEARPDDGKFTIGSVSHVMFLEPEQFEATVVVVEFDDWRKKDAKEAREAASEAGKIAILAKHHARIVQARNAFMSDPFIARAFTALTADQRTALLPQHDNLKSTAAAADAERDRIAAEQKEAASEPDLADPFGSGPAIPGGIEQPTNVGAAA